MLQTKNSTDYLLNTYKPHHDAGRRGDHYDAANAWSVQYGMTLVSRFAGTCCCVLSACSFWLYYPSGYDFGLVGLDFFCSRSECATFLTNENARRPGRFSCTYLFRSSYSVYCLVVTFVVVVGVGVCRCLGTGNGACSLLVLRFERI